MHTPRCLWPTEYRHGSKGLKQGQHCHHTRPPHSCRPRVLHHCTAPTCSRAPASYQERCTAMNLRALLPRGPSGRSGCRHRDLQEITALLCQETLTCIHHGHHHTHTATRAHARTHTLARTQARTHAHTPWDLFRCTCQNGPRLESRRPSTCIVLLYLFNLPLAHLKWCLSSYCCKATHLQAYPPSAQIMVAITAPTRGSVWALFAPIWIFD